MRKKSKFKSLLLSAVPGIGHIYLGLTSRGIIFLGAFLSVIFILNFLQGSGFNYGGMYRFRYHNGYREFFEFFLPLIWVFSAVDAYIMTERVNRFMTVSEGLEADISAYDKAMKPDNQKLLTIMLNIIPGAGHIYCGQKEKGLKLMGIFIIVLILFSLSGFGLLALLAAFIWLYSLLELIGSFEGKVPVAGISPEAFDVTGYFSGLGNRLSWVGGALIAAGALLIVNRITGDVFDPKILSLVKSYMKDIIVSALLIVIGLRLLMGDKRKTV